MAKIEDITDLAAGDDWPIVHTVGTEAEPIPSGVKLVKGFLKLAQTLQEVDGAPLINKEITINASASGQIEDDNADNGGVGRLRFKVPRAETGLQRYKPYGYIIRIEYSDGNQITSQEGNLIPQ